MAEKTGAAATLKDFVTFMREGTIALVLLLFLVMPGAMKGVLKRAGFTSADIAGFKWELQQSAQQTQAASDTVAHLEERLAVLDSGLKAVSQSPDTTPQVRHQISQMSVELSRTREQTREVQGTLRDSIQTQQFIVRQVAPELLERARPTPAPARKAR